MELEIFSDSSFSDFQETSRSTGGYIFLLNKSPIAFRSFQQKIVSLSSAESELYSIVETVKHYQYIINILEELKIIKINSPQIIYTDNLAAKAITTSEPGKIFDRSKHIKRKNHFIRDLVKQGEISIEYVASSNNIADIFTKALGKSEFIKFREQMNIKKFNNNIII